MKVHDRIEAYGANACTNGELLQAITGKKYNVNTIDELEIILDSLPREGQIRIKAAVELTKRLLADKSKTHIHGPEDIACYAKSYFAGLEVEHFCILCLDTKNAIKSIETISTGSLTASIVHPREVFNAAIKKRAAT